MVARQEAGGISGWAKKNEEIKKYKLVVTEQSQGCQKAKRKSKKLEIYLKKIMKENCPNLQIQEAQKVPSKMDVNRQL